LKVEQAVTMLISLNFSKDKTRKTMALIDNNRVILMFPRKSLHENPLR